jgi:hypothetical protein
LIFPFGKPHPEEDFQPFTSTTWTMQPELMHSPERNMNVDLIPSVIEHDCATNGYSGFVSHEMVEGTVVVTPPSFKERTCLEKHFGELFEGQ